MNITLVVGGRWHAFDLARELHLRGNLHRIITNYPTWVVARWEIPKEKIKSLPATFYLIKAIYKIGGEGLMMRMQWLVHQWFAKEAALHLSGSELVHAWSSFAEPSLIWAKERGIPTVLERSSAHILEQSKILNREHQKLGINWTKTHSKIEHMELREYELAERIAVPSLFVERSFLERGVARNKLVRNPFGVNTDAFTPGAEHPVSPTKSGEFRIVFAGALSIQKGTHDLLRAFELLDIDNAELLLLGGKNKHLDYLLKAQPKNVKVLGHRPQAELVTHYRKCHCFVMPSIQEGMAMVQLQALSCGLPLICTTNTGGEDLLRLQGNNKRQITGDINEFDAGFVIPVNSPSLIVECLKRIALEPGLWEKKREAAIRLAKNDLSWKKYGERATTNYRSLLGERRSNPGYET